MAITKSIPVIDYFTGANSPSLTITLTKSDGSGALDLGSADGVKCKLRLLGGTSNAFTGTLDSGSITDASSGIFTYTLPTGGLSDVGVYIGQAEVDWGGNIYEYSGKFNLNVEDSL